MCASAPLQVPTLQTPEGGVWESNAIARYVARLADKGLFGATSFDAVRLFFIVGCPLLKNLQSSRARQYEQRNDIKIPTCRLKLNSGLSSLLWSWMHP